MTLLSSICVNKVELAMQSGTHGQHRDDTERASLSFWCRVVDASLAVHTTVVNLPSLHQHLKDIVNLVNSVNGIALISSQVSDYHQQRQSLAEGKEIGYGIRGTALADGLHSVVGESADRIAVSHACKLYCKFFFIHLRSIASVQFRITEATSPLTDSKVLTALA